MPQQVHCHCDAGDRRASTADAPSALPGHHSPAGGDQMQVRVILPIAAMGVEHGDIAPRSALPLTVLKKSSRHCAPQRMNALNTTAAFW